MKTLVSAGILAFTLFAPIQATASEDSQTFTLRANAPMFTCYRAMRMATAYLEVPDEQARQRGLSQLAKSGEFLLNNSPERSYKMVGCVDGDCQHVQVKADNSSKTFYVYRQTLTPESPISLK